jgi:hypothetical protein
MSSHQQFITLDSCITDYLTESEQSNQKYFKLFHLAFRGMDELGIDFFYQVRTAKIPVETNKTVKLPSDFINYTKVGVLTSQGQIAPLSYNEKFTNYASLDPNRVSKVSGADGYSAQSNIWYNYNSGSGFDNLYGLPGGNTIGKFKLDSAAGVIILNVDFEYDYVMLEYVAAPKDDQEYFIPRVFREAMIAWMAWKDSPSNPKGHYSVNNKAALRHEFFEARRKGRDKYKPFQIGHEYDSIAEQQRTSIKS